MTPRNVQQRSRTTSTPSTAPRWLVFALALLVFAGTFIAFAPSFRNQFLNWDDDANFTNNQSWRGLGSQQLGWMFTSFYNGHYTPVTWLTLGLDYELATRIFGDDPRFGRGMDGRVYHTSNVIYHAINAVLVFLIALRLIGCALKRDPRFRSPATCLAAAMAAMLWGVHPLRVENVAWITERRDVIGATLMLASVLAYL